MTALSIDPRRNGDWGIELEGGASTTLSVGGHLTAVARDGGSVHETILACLKHSYIKPPSAKRIDRYLNTSGPPAHLNSPRRLLDLIVDT